MAYMTLDEAKQFLGVIYESAYLDDVTEIPNDTILQEDIDAMTAVIDSYIKRSYDQTITGTASLVLLKNYCQSLLLRKAYSRFDNSGVPDSVQTEHDEAIFRLKDLAKGLSFLPDEEQDPRNSSIEFKYNQGKFSGNSKQVFTRDRMAGY